MGNSSSKNQLEYQQNLQLSPVSIHLTKYQNVKQVNLKKINPLKEQNQSDKRDSLSIVSTGNTSQFSSPAGDVQRFGNVLPLNEPPYNVQGHMYEKRRDQQRPQRSISQLSVKSQTSSFSFVGNQRFEYDQLDSGHDNVSESKRLLKNTAENSGCEKTIETKRKKKKKKKHLRKAVEPQTVPDSWADKKNSSPRKSEHSAEEHEEHDISECTHQMEDFDLTDVRKQLASVATAKREADFQIKVMKIKAERLAKVCEGDSENGSFDNDNICPKDYLQSICYVKKHIVNQNNKLDLLEKEKQSYLNRLSSFAGAMLSDDNPNITDLNDPKRPTKLAEQLGSIYDNDWTDAMEMLEQSLPNTEENKEKCAHHLYCVIKVIFQTCKLKADVQLQGITEHYFLLNSPSLDQIKGWWLNYPSERKKIIDGRKITAMGVIKQLEETLKDDQVFLQQMNDCYPKLDLDMFDVLLSTSYFKKCIDICWNLVIQDPPMYLETAKLEGKLLDKEHYKEYTKSGTKIKYVVWPALYLFCNDEKGPLMAKGVVQVN